MTRVQSILNKARIELGDKDERRYPTDMLISFLNDGIKDFVLGTKCLKERLFVELKDNVAVYDINDYSLFVERVEYMNVEVPTLSYRDLDGINAEWQFERGKIVKAVTFDHQNKGAFRIYPLLEGVNAGLTYSSDYGILVDITLDDDILGLPSLPNLESDLPKYLVVYSIKKPNKVSATTTDEELEVDASYDAAFVHYIKYKCLRSDTDAGNRAYGDEEMQAFSMYITREARDFALDNQISGNRVIEYRGFI